ncbi:MAG: arylsulfatase [Planctomycetota bacterium]
MNRSVFVSLLVANACLASAQDHPSLFLTKGQSYSQADFDAGTVPEMIELRGGSTAQVHDGILVVENNGPRETPFPRPVLHYKDVPDEFVCHMRIKMDGNTYHPKNPWLDIGGMHRNHFRFDENQVLFSSESKELSKRTIDNGRVGNMLPLNEWLHVTIEIEKNRIGLSINGVTQIYRDPNIEIGAARKIGMKAICGGKLHVDYIRVWEPLPELKERTRPNIIAILTDDQGWGDLSIHGNTALHTPHIDQLARGGASLDRFYVSPVCSPTRAEFLTGRHHVRCGVYSTSEGGERVNRDETMIGEVFRDAGYRTAAFGKWHSGMQYPYHPTARGFEDFYGFCSGHWGNYFSPMLEHNNQMVQGSGFIIDDLTNRAMDYVEQHQTEPFFVYLPYNTPHSPMQVPDRWWKKFKDMQLPANHPKVQPNYLEHTRAAFAMCENIDWNVGRLMGKLDELSLAENTIVIYFSDNGPNGNRFNAGMRGRKGSTDEGGVRSPLFVHWPSKIKAGVNIPEICSAMDLLPTLADLAGIEIASSKPLDGLSLAPLLLQTYEERQTDVRWKDRTLVHHWNDKVSVRTQQYRLDHAGRLYDIPRDPSQSHPINESEPGVAAKLKRVANDFRATMLREFGKDFDTRPFVIGHPDAKRTQIPARDGIAHGNIKRSNRFPNDSFFRNWSQLEDSITWNCEVGQAGTYQVDIFYTCPASDVGSTIELTFDDQSLIGKIVDAHDPPLLGMRQDRFKRIESYVKEFKRMTMGKIELREGEGVLELKAKEIPGSQVMDFRLMLLTRMEP